MKIFMLVILFLMAHPLQAACKCNCNPADNRICASGISLGRPCPSICTNSAGAMPMNTACPMVEVVNPITKVKYWMCI